MSFRPRAWYQPKKDGTLEEYFLTHDGHITFPLFHGWAHYKMLWDRGYLEPNISVIRLMWNIGREDEHFGVLGEHEIEGITDIAAHRGRPGKFDPQKLLAERDCPPWEAQNLNPHPVPRR
jgi:hypothetical protein